MRHEDRANLRQEILVAAWELFDKNGYEKTTVNEIIKKANTSKGGFYYYFKAKEELLNSLYAIFDREYEKIYESMDKSLDCMMQLKLLNQYVAYFIEANVSPALLAEMYRSQLMQKQQESFWGENRYYMHLVKKIITEGQKKGEIRSDIPANELTHHVMSLERGIFVDWCVRNGGFPLGYYGEHCFSLYSEFMKPVK
jgi:AcrR family transcriptional regulator